MESFETQPHSFLPEVSTGKFWICLPGLLTIGRYLLDNLGFVCLLLSLTADIYTNFLLLSACFFHWRQTYTQISCFCLPASFTGGRHIHKFLAFVCLLLSLTADIYTNFLLLSACFFHWRQTYTGISWICPPGSLTDGRQNTGNQSFICCGCLWSRFMAARGHRRTSEGIRGQVWA